jgi:gliding motility-associated-like protein
LKYSFSIYNRWGQVVFQTTDIHKGWDGHYGGAQQSMNTFVWICSYKFDNEEMKSQKGTVVLLR